MARDANAARRRFVLGAAGSAIALSAAELRAEDPSYVVPQDPTRALGIPLPESGYGTRSRFEASERQRAKTATPYSSWSFTPLQDLYGIVTPSGLHFERSHGGTAIIDPARHSLYIHGMVERPRKYAMADLVRFPSVSQLLFIECSGNTLTEWWKPNLQTVQGTHGLTSTSEWTGVPLATLLREALSSPARSGCSRRAADAASMTRSIPLDKAMRDVIVAYGQNGEALRPEQGYPLRLVIPGFEGNMNIKWLRRLEVSDMPFMTREETSKYTDLHADGRAVQFSFVMEAKSVITSPSGGQRLAAPGFHEITGIAWSGRGAIRRVDISTDGGRSWRPAMLQEPVLPRCHTRFRFPWTWDGSESVLQSRCVDQTGYVQPTIQQLIAVRGINGPLGSVYHENGIQSWKVATDGKVSNVHFYT